MESLETWFEYMRARARRPGKPVVTLSYAQSLDGCLTLMAGQPFAISAQETKALTHRLRTLHDAILVGIGTVLADDPHLGVRYAVGPEPRPVVLDAQLRIPEGCRLLAREHNLPWIVTSPSADPERKQKLQRAGVEVISLDCDNRGSISLSALLEVLVQRGVRSLMVEGGARVLTSFFQQRLGDLAVVTVSPIFLGGLSVTTAPLASGGNVPVLQEAECEQMGPDWVLRGRLGEQAI